MKKNQIPLNLSKTTLFVFKSKKNVNRSFTDPTVIPTTSMPPLITGTGAKH